MKLRIEHRTEYNFSTDAYLEPHILRFQPKNMHYIRNHSFDLIVKPTPSTFSRQFDAEGNFVHVCWFENLHKQLIVSAVSELEVQQFSSFDFIIYPFECTQLPLSYSDELRLLLSASLMIEPLSEGLTNYVKELQDQSESLTLAFLTNIVKKIHQDFQLKPREFGAPFSPSKTFEQKTGSCRDLTWMHIHMLRSLGIAARFVSGYFFIKVSNPTYELHAWLEVYLPGAGWIGFDPSYGIATGHNHIPIASSAQYSNTMPISGSIRGDASTELSTNLSISLV